MKTACYVYIAVQLKYLGSKFLYAVEPQGRKDFNNTVQNIIFHPNDAETMNVTIEIFVDTINEADEGFVVIVMGDQAVSNMQRVALVTILDDDHEFEMYIEGLRTKVYTDCKSTSYFGIVANPIQQSTNLQTNTIVRLGIAECYILVRLCNQGFC